LDGARFARNDGGKDKQKKSVKKFVFQGTKLYLCGAIGILVSNLNNKHNERFCIRHRHWRHQHQNRLGGQAGKY
jgi:hypothetical protein